MSVPRSNHFGGLLGASQANSRSSSSRGGRTAGSSRQRFHGASPTTPSSSITESAMTPVMSPIESPDDAFPSFLLDHVESEIKKKRLFPKLWTRRTPTGVDELQDASSILGPSIMTTPSVHSTRSAMADLASDANHVLGAFRRQREAREFKQRQRRQQPPPSSSSSRSSKKDSLLGSTLVFATDDERDSVSSRSSATSGSSRYLSASQSTPDGVAVTNTEHMMTPASLGKAKVSTAANKSSAEASRRGKRESISSSAPKPTSYQPPSQLPNAATKEEKQKKPPSSKIRSRTAPKAPPTTYHPPLPPPPFGNDVPIDMSSPSSLPPLRMAPLAMGHVLPRIPSGTSSAMGLDTQMSLSFDTYAVGLHPDLDPREPMENGPAKNYCELQEQVGGAFEETTIAVAPGVALPLRGSRATFDAIRQCRLTSAVCTSCHEHLNRLDDAAWILCPQCRTIEPLAESGHGRGVALGFLASDYDVLKEHVHRMRA